MLTKTMRFIWDTIYISQLCQPIQMKVHIHSRKYEILRAGSQNDGGYIVADYLYVINGKVYYRG